MPRMSSLKINGIEPARLRDDKGRTAGHFALQMHAGCVMHVMFKDIEIKKDAAAK